ncbi:MAG: hypothetical protein KTR35_00760 [Gammaproteobacteria bacterium]|nr:hypothetical protein [Gammaproteobacteria bacterium]
MLSVRAALTAAVIAGIVLAYQLGVQNGKKAAVVTVASRGGNSSDAEELQAKNKQLSQALSKAQQEVAVKTVTLNALREDLVDAKSRRFDDARELALYRKIQTEGSNAGLTIDELHREESSAGELIALSFTLLQYQGTKRATGSLQLSVSGGDADGPFKLAVLAADQSIDHPFDLRFFQIFEVPLGQELPPEIDTLEISILPEGDNHKSAQMQFEWDEIRTQRP